LCANSQPVLCPAHIELDVLLLSVARGCAYGGLGDGIVGSEDFEGFGVARGAGRLLGLAGLKVHARYWTLVVVLQGGLPGVCEDDVVARGVSAAAAGCGRASEAEFEDHVGGVMCRGLAVAMVCASINQLPSSSRSRSYNLRSGDELRVRGVSLFGTTTLG
jgi:hypothetical protein